MTATPNILFKTKVDALLPRDASAMRRPISSTSARAPLGLRIIDGPDDEPEAEEPDEDMSEARSADMIAYRDAHGGNRGAFLSDVDILIERALKQARKSMLNLFAQIIGEVIGEMGDDLRKEFEDKLAGGAVRELQLERERDRATIGEMRSKIAELDFVVERLERPALGSNRSGIPESARF
jgi:hypothetical protein